jgi:hypothetical protein
MRHFKIIGWLWLLFGLFFSLVAARWLLVPSRPPDSPYKVVESSYVWWQEVGLDTLEVAFFVSSAIGGFGLIRHRRWARTLIGILGGLLLAWSVCLISSVEQPFATDLLSLGPFALLGLYSLIVVALCKYEYA